MILPVIFREKIVEAEENEKEKCSDADSCGSPCLSAYERICRRGAGWNETDASQTAAAQGGAWEAWSEEWETIKNDWTQVSMSPGADETKMNFAWYSRTGEAADFIYGTAVDLSDGQAATVTQTSAQEGYMSNKVTLENLKPGTTYYYQVSGKEIESFTTDDDTADFSFIFVGDPQIGSSNAEKAKKPEDIKKPTFVTAQSEAVRNDTFNWNYTLNRAYAKTGNKAGFILSSGDQIQTNAEKVQDPTVSEMEYAGYLSPDIMKSVPVATTVGNHDADNQNYQYHFNITNLSNLGNNDYNVGGDYYFTYGDALFIILNTQDTNVAEHKEFIEKTVAANAELQVADCDASPGYLRLCGTFQRTGNHKPALQSCADLRGK